MIGTCWFMGASIESVTISASVKEICADAFCNCHMLHEVVLEPDSTLEKIGQRCFRNSAITQMTVPATVR